MKKTIIMALLAAASVSASAQQKQTIEIPSWLSNVKLSGYGMTQYQYSGQKDAESNSFNIRMARISLEGRIAGDFYWKTQIQFNGNTSTLGSSPRMVDLFAEWQKYEYFKVKIGQFKNPFTFENPEQLFATLVSSGGNRRLPLAALNNRDFVVWAGHFVSLLSVIGGWGGALPPHFGQKKSRQPFSDFLLGVPLCGRRIFSCKSSGAS